MFDVNWFEKEIKSLPMQTRIAAAAWVMKHIVDHAKEGGSFRHLIYSRLGLDTSAYVPLCSDGMTISNEFDLNSNQHIVEALKQNDISKVKYLLGLCQQPDCWDFASTWSPGVNGTVALCSKHYSEQNP